MAESHQRVLNVQEFTQAVVLMSVFERRLSFPMLYFMKTYHEIVLQ